MQKHTQMEKTYFLKSKKPTKMLKSKEKFAKKILNKNCTALKRAFSLTTSVASETCCIASAATGKTLASEEIIKHLFRLSNFPDIC